LAADWQSGSEQDYVTAWGKPQAGLQDGIRCREQQQIIRGEEVADFVLIVRNVSSKSIRFKYLPASRYIASVDDTTVAVDYIYGGKGIPDTVTLQPDEIREVGSLSLGRERPKGDGVTASRHIAQLLPGRYQVGCDEVLVRYDKETPKLTTGYLDMEITDLLKK
jgi:hypothetical protein